MNTNEKCTTHIPTGFNHYDRISGGFTKGELIVIGGRPGIGKTNFMINLCSDIAKQEYSCAFITLELSTKQLLKRFIEHDNATKKIEDSNFDISSTFFNLPIWICDNQIRENFDLNKLCKALAVDQKVDIIFIDYFQLIGDWNKHSNHELYGIIEQLKFIAKEFNLTIVIASSLIREIDSRPLLERRPKLFDLFRIDESDDNLDEILFLYRNDYYGIIGEETDKNTADVELIIAKKSFGFLDTIHLELDKSHLVFKDKSML